MKAALAALAIIAVLGLVGNADYEDEQKQVDHYASMVCDGYWPNYENRNLECGDESR